MKVFAVCNQKGGVGKTTTVSAISTVLHDAGKKVLAVDLDPQCNLTFGAGIDIINTEYTVYNLFKKSAPVKDIIVPTPIGYDLVPGGLDLAGSDMEFTQTGREYLLKEGLAPIEANYDYIVIDTPPTLGILTINAMAAADSIVIPATADIYALQGMTQLDGLINNVRRYCNPGLTISGILITRDEARTNVSKAVTARIHTIAADMGTIVFSSKIRDCVKVREAALYKEDVTKKTPTAPASADYIDFVSELIGGCDS